jgi:alpha-beta hydrolase superfamily lysophospholipase
VRKLVVMILLVIVTIYLVRAFDSRGMMDLRIWHLASLDSEFRARDERPDLTLDDYLEMEDRLYEELNDKIYQHVEPTLDLYFSRYSADSPVNPARYEQDWNRTFELTPQEVRGGVLLLHGLTDSPYSLRRAGEIFQEHGFYVLGLRIPGHGTIPGAIASITMEDWMAATRVAARHVHAETDGRGPFYVLGYSNGGALAVKYALEAIESEDLAVPDRLVLISPAIGVTPFSAIATWHKALSWMGYFEKFKWQSIEPEYDSFKYVSFPKNAGAQIYELTKSVKNHLANLAQDGRISQMPPVLTFQSLVDTTVLTDAIVDDLYARLAPGGGHELILFDINRVAQLQYFLVSSNSPLLERIERSTDLPYTLTVVTNVREDTLEVMARTRNAGAPTGSEVPLGLSWPSAVYSLSHIALPFAVDDPHYGGIVGETTEYGLRLGSIAPRGERDMLRMSMSGLMRLRYNPFFEYLEQRLRQAMPNVGSEEEPSDPSD